MTILLAFVRRGYYNGRGQSPAAFTAPDPAATVREAMAGKTVIVTDDQGEPACASWQDGAAGRLMRRPKQRPRMTAQAARAIADKLVVRERGGVPPSDGARYEGAPNAAWTFSYRRETVPGEVTDPSHLLVVVEVEMKKASFFLTMGGALRARDAPVSLTIAAVQAAMIARAVRRASSLRSLALSAA